MTEPQTISTALTAQLVINRIYRDQLTIQATIPKNQPPRKPDEKIKLMGIDDMDKHQVFFNLIFIIAPFEITGFVSLHKHIIEREPLPPGSLDTLKRIKPIALKNMELWNEIQRIEPDEKIFACYEIHPDSSISRKYKRSGDYEGQRFTNDDLFRYCDSVEDLISSCLPKDAPPAKDQEPTYNTLLEAFKDVSEYKRVMAIMQSKGYITADYIWQDQKKGWMTAIVSIIKLFAVKGYCKKTKFDPAEIQAICINTFQTENISISTIKHASPNNITLNFD